MPYGLDIGQNTVGSCVGRVSQQECLVSGGDLSLACLWFSSLWALLTCLSCFSVAMMIYNDPVSLQKKKFIESMSIVVENVAAGREGCCTAAVV